jgi:acetyl esterase
MAKIAVEYHRANVYPARTSSEVMVMTTFDVSAPYEIEEFDEPYARPQGVELLARVYRPKGRPAGLPALVDVHGGAWNSNDRTTSALLGRALAACGLVVASLDFRQGPEHQHPAASADVAAGVRWVRANATRLGADGTRVGLVGSSSGGQLALLVALTPGVPEHVGTPIVLPDGSLDAALRDESVAFAVAFYPVVDPLARFRYVLTRESEPVEPGGFNAKRLIASHRGYFQGETAMAAASVTRIVAERKARALPPVWLAQPDLDDNVPAAITDAFVRAYQEAGGQIERERFPAARHGFITRPEAATDKAIALVRDFIGRQVQRA